MATGTTPALLELRTDAVASPVLERQDTAFKPYVFPAAPLSSRSDSFASHGPGFAMRSASTKRPQLLQTLSDASDASQETLSSVRRLPRNRPDTGEGSKASGEENGWHMRHGWDSQYSAEQLRELSTVCSPTFLFGRADVQRHRISTCTSTTSDMKLAAGLKELRKLVRCKSGG